MVVNFKKIQALVVISASILISNCTKSNDPEVLCATYYLSQEIIANQPNMYYYNDDGRLSYMALNNGQYLQFSYSDNLLRTIDGPTVKYKFGYDGSNRLVYTRTIGIGAGNNTNDSITYAYDGSNHITRRDRYAAPGTSVPLTTYISEYSGNNANSTLYYGYNNDGTPALASASKFFFTYDDKKRPYPQDYFLFDLAISNVSSENNVTSIQIVKNGASPDPNPNKTQYEYNSAGYPTKTSALTTYTYACTPPKR